MKVGESSHSPIKPTGISSGGGSSSGDVKSKETDSSDSAQVSDNVGGDGVGDTE
ncbi:unnamed protein product [Trichobilharzia regenti]|nr:unnamed protein product [Trichobilharzia regenti]